MRKKTATINVTYTYTATYEHDDHLAYLKSEIEKEPFIEMGGVGAASDDRVYPYSCKRTGNGVIFD